MTVEERIGAGEAGAGQGGPEFCGDVIQQRGKASVGEVEGLGLRHLLGGEGGPDLQPDHRGIAKGRAGGGGEGDIGIAARLRVKPARAPADQQPSGVGVLQRHACALGKGEARADLGREGQGQIVMNGRADQADFMDFCAGLMCHLAGQQRPRKARDKP